MTEQQIIGKYGQCPFGLNLYLFLILSLQQWLKKYAFSKILRWKPQDALVAKAPKRNPLILRMVVLLFAMVCGLYIFTFCIRQTNRNNDPLKIQVIDRRRNWHCRTAQIQEWDIPYIHFPEPETFSRHECACNPVRFFVIVSMQRSGSGWFETLLNSHINLSSNGEIMGAQDTRRNVSMILKTLDQVYNLDWLSSASKNECTAAVGFKWMLNQGLMLHHEAITDYFNRRGVYVIFLFRRNLLRRLVSVLANVFDKNSKPLNGTHKSHVHSQHEAQVLAKYKPTLNATVLVSHLRAADQTVAKALEYFKSTRHIVLYYEDIVRNSTKLEEVQEFLNLPRRNLTSLQVRIHSGPLAKQIENWEVVRETLKGTSYENFLHADHKL
ncbi:unnamed protein product [Fraxinus pennsylvanica]|uniref:Sulfotransferase n=1 Tax=Fraxinus pennsylvanica TaxID=56036 RepID=A0AAD1Z665_9LAMI|nr:unnamed protein product [Fraxinus pennsylvanica]